MFNIRQYLGGVINHDNAANPIPDELLNKVDESINELIKYVVDAKKRNQPAEPPVEPRTPEEFKAVLTDFIGHMGLDDFYPANDPYVRELCKRAAALVDDITATLNTPEEVADLTKLALYDTVIYCDDSASMNIGDRVTAVKDLVSRVAKITTMLDTNGIKVRFINFEGDGDYNNVRNLAEVEDMISRVPFEGYTPIGTKLQSKILDPLLFANTRTQSLKKPLLITTITDGAPNDEDPGHFRQVILNCKNTMKTHGYKSSTAVFQVSQVGDEADAEAFIMGLHKDPEVGRMVYCTSEKLDQQVDKLKKNDRDMERWLLDLLLKGIRRPVKP